MADEIKHPTPEEVAAQAMSDLTGGKAGQVFEEGVNVLTEKDPILIFKPQTVGAGMGIHMHGDKEGEEGASDQVLYMEGAMGTPTQVLSPQAKIGIVLTEPNRVLQVVHSLLVGVLTKTSVDDFMEKIAAKVMEEIEDPDESVIPELWVMTAELAEAGGGTTEVKRK